MLRFPRHKSIEQRHIGHILWWYHPTLSNLSHPIEAFSNRVRILAQHFDIQTALRYRSNNLTKLPDEGMTRIGIIEILDPWLVCARN